MVVVKLGQDKGFQVAGRVNAHRAQLVSDFIAGFDVEVHGELEERVPPRKEPGFGGLTAVQQDQSLGMLDEIGVDGQRFGPLAVGEHRKTATPDGSYSRPGAWSGCGWCRS